jgi:hypothetical protein
MTRETVAPETKKWSADAVSEKVDKNRLVRSKF